MKSSKRFEGSVTSRVKHPLIPFVIFLIIFPYFLPYTSLGIEMVIFGIFAMGLNFLMRYAGLVSFGHALYWGMGAYATGLILKHYNPPLLLAILFGIIVSMGMMRREDWLSLSKR